MDEQDHEHFGKRFKRRNKEIMFCHREFGEGFKPKSGNDTKVE